MEHIDRTEEEQSQNVILKPGPGHFELPLNMESLIDTSEVTSPKCRIFSEELQCIEESKLGLI